MAYAVDFRRKVLEIKEREGLSFEKVAERFGIGQISVFRWSKHLIPCLHKDKPSEKKYGCFGAGCGKAARCLSVGTCGAFRL